MVQSETSSQDVLRDEILADARRQAERAIRKAEREAQAAIDKAKAESQQERDSKLATARAAAERKRTLALATVPIEIGRLRAARAEQELTMLRDTIREKLSTREGMDYGAALVTLAAEAIARMAGEAFVLELSKADRQAFGSHAGGRSARSGQTTRYQIDHQHPTGKHPGRRDCTRPAGAAGLGQ